MALSIAVIVVASPAPAPAHPPLAAALKDQPVPKQYISLKSGRKQTQREERQLRPQAHSSVLSAATRVDELLEVSPFAL